MICENCSVIIRPEFTYAIMENKCPACGKLIMQKAKLAAFLDLRTLLEKNTKGVDIDKLSSLIVANFEIKQLSKEEVEKESEGGIIEVVEDVAPKDPDAESKKQQRIEAKEILQKMRDEVLTGAVQERYDLGNSDSLLLPDDVSTHEIVSEEIKRQKQDVILSGVGGKNSFRRSE